MNQKMKFVNECLWPLLAVLAFIALLGGVSTTVEVFGPDSFYLALAVLAVILGGVFYAASAQVPKHLRWLLCSLFVLCAALSLWHYAHVTGQPNLGGYPKSSPPAGYPKSTPPRG